MLRSKSRGSRFIDGWQNLGFRRHRGFDPIGGSGGGGSHTGSLQGVPFFVAQGGRGDRNGNGRWGVSILFGQNGGDSNRSLLDRGVGNRNGFGGASGLDRSGHNPVAAQLLDFGPHLSDMRINALPAVDCKVDRILESFPSWSSVRFGVSGSARTRLRQRPDRGGGMIGRSVREE